MSERKTHRSFLEPINGDANSYVVVRGTRLTIADCNDVIDLSFSQSQRRALTKLGKLRTALAVLEENIRAAKRTRDDW